MNIDETCGRCACAYFPVDPETGARKWRGRCGLHMQTVYQHFKCSCKGFIKRVGDEAGVGPGEQKGEE